MARNNKRIEAKDCQPFYINGKETADGAICEKEDARGVSNEAKVLSKFVESIVPISIFGSDLKDEDTDSKLAYSPFENQTYTWIENGIEIKAEDTNQITIVEYENHYFTTLLIKDENDLELLLKEIRLIDDTKSYPEWIIALDYFDDELLKKRNLAIKESINKLENEYNSNVIKLNTNNMYKNIVCLSGQDLVKVVFDILEQILQALHYLHD